jgi:putative membrane protein
MFKRGFELTASGVRRLSVALALAGIAVATLLIGYYGFSRVARATTSVGFGGFALVCAWQLALFALLGLCWFVLRRGGRDWRLSVLIWGRMVRDAAGQCLPFSLVGGFVLGARAVTLRGVCWPDAAASTVVDLSAEFFAQIGLVLIGAGILATRAPGATLIGPVLLGVLVAITAGAGFLWLQRGAGSPLLLVSRHLLGGWSAGAEPHMAAIQRRLTGFYSHPRRVALCTFLHLAGWFGTGVASFIAFRLLGAQIDFFAALGIEALLHAVLALAVLVPGYAGVQEAAYIAVGALFGQPPTLCLSVSLLRRARDIALGIPILLVWQSHEWQARRTPA